MRKYVIIGSGVAGVAAVQAIRKIDSSGQILVIGDDPHGYYSRPGMAYYLTREVSEDFLFPFNKERFSQMKAQHLNDRVTHIYPNWHNLECLSGKRLDYDRLLIATGSNATGLSVPGADLEGVVKLDTLEDAKKILKLARKGRTAVVCGGGITALELVEALSSHGTQVHFFWHGNYFWHNVLEIAESRIVEERIEKEGVRIHRGTDLVEILGRGGKVAGVITKDGQQLKADMVAVAIGVRPTKALAEACGIQVDRGILVDPMMRTNLADIFAAGDVAQVFDPLANKWVVESLWGTASLQGQCAGLNMAGLATPYNRPPSVNVTRLAGVTTAIIGALGNNLQEDDESLSITHGDSEAWRNSLEAIVTRVDYDVNHVRVMVGEKTLTGAVVMGEQSLTPVLRDLIARQVDITSIRAALIAPNAPVGRLIHSFSAQMETGHGA